MKKIAILLGLKEKATEAEILQSITGLQNSNTALDKANKEYEKKAQEHENAVKNLHTECERLAAEKNRLDNALAEGEKEITSLKEQLGNTDNEGKAVTLTPEEQAQMDDLKAKATEAMEANSVKFIYMTTDGTPFFTREDANRYAVGKNLSVISFGDITVQ